MIDLVNITQHYGVRPILRGVSLRVEPGELLAVMGPNGTGKSTLLKVVAGVLWPQEGYVEINGRRRRASEADELAIRRQVVYLPDQAFLPASLTGREFLMAVGRLYGVDDLRLMDHVERLLVLFDMTPKADAAVSTYSTGQRKKIGLCSALVTEAPIMLLDEPFAGGLDPSGILALERVLQRLVKERGVTVMMATPVPELVEAVSTRIAVIKDGGLLAVDTPAGLRQRTGCDGPLQEVLERLVQPRTLQHIDEYFQGSR